MSKTRASVQHLPNCRHSEENVLHVKGNSVQMEQPDIELHHGTEIVHLNVGGTRYSTLYETLATANSPFFQHFVRVDARSGKIIRYNKNIIDDGTGAIFVNRDGSNFAHVLQYMRDGKNTVLPQSIDRLRVIAREARFFAMEGLMRMCEDLLAVEENRTDDTNKILEDIYSQMRQLNTSMSYSTFRSAH